MKCSPKERISEEDIAEHVEKIPKERGSTTLEEAKNRILQEEFECKEGEGGPNLLHVSIFGRRF